MGRGRAKAKQTKVARALKYAGPETDLERLQRELAANGDTSADASEDAEDDVEDDDEDGEADPYAKYYDDEDEDTAHSA